MTAFSCFASRPILCFAARTTGSTPVSRPHIVVAASGGGSNVKAIIEAQRAGRLHAIIAGLIVSSESAGALDIAAEADIPCAVLKKEEKQCPKRLATALLRQLEAWQCDVFVLAGFLLKIPEIVIDRYPRHILNIHPSLLPAFGGKGYYGMHVHRAVVRSGVRETGCSVHIVNEAFDEGPVLEQARLTVHPDDTPETLAARVLALEHRLYPAAIDRYLKQLSISNSAPKS